MSQDNMAGSMNFSALKARTMDAGSDEAVTVNTRALIDKVLARYSGEWTVLRELLQNAADASATSVKITFETVPSATVPAPQSADPSTTLKHVLAYHTLKRLVINNNGQPFSSTDWNRLKRIAEGNPDETKIGAFGVGFYSVFSDCEEPFVSSGKEAMGFFWKGNSLFTRFLKLDDSEANTDTNFVLDYRNATSPVPPLLPLCQFLANSLTFVGIQSIELYVDSWKILSLSKKTAPSVGVNIPKDVERRTADGLMQITQVSREVAQLDGTWMSAVGWKPPKTSTSNTENIARNEGAESFRSFFSRLAGKQNSEKKVEKPKKEVIPEDISTTTSSTVFLHIHTAVIKTTVSQSFSQELERATKKPPPKTTRLAVLTSPYDAPPSYDTAIAPKDPSLDVFATVLPSKLGRIFIGFPTHQTTGLNAHVSAPSVIPTVERESIDLNARYVRTWNIELLRAAGIVCRIAWATEMSLIKENLSRAIEKLGKTKVRRDDVKSVLPDAIHTSNQFDFRESTPSPRVGEMLENAFWTCCKTASISVLSTCGVLQSHEVRIAPKDLSFMEGIPVLPDELVEGAKGFVRKLIDFGLLVDITVADIKRELENNALTAAQLMEFLKWLARKSISGDIEKSVVQTLLSVAIANDEGPDGAVCGMLAMSQYHSYLNVSRIPPELPVPPNVMPFKYTKVLSKNDLAALGWEELQTVPWIRWLVMHAQNRQLLTAEQDITSSPPFAAQILPVLSKQWDTLSASSKESVINLLQSNTVIPTKLGMRKPPETYFQSVKLFDDLPTVTGLNSVKEKFLGALGVRKTVELGVIFERLLNNNTQTQDKAGADSKGRWSHVDLIRYLASVSSDIPAKDIERLKNTAICPAETREGSQWRHGQLFRVSELFEPTQSLRELGLPLLDWPGIYRDSLAEGKFLTMLGLRKYPSAMELIHILAEAAAKGNDNVRIKAMGYYLVNYYNNGYSQLDLSKVTIPFLPIQGSSKLSVPSRCFTDDAAALFGFEILQHDLRPQSAKLGVSQHPPIIECVEVFLRRRPASHKEARDFFKYFSSRLGELNATVSERIASSKIVPIMPRTGSSEKFDGVATRYVAPRDCYLGDSELYREIFDFVDFGQEANAFLLKCGSKHEPTTHEVAQMLVKKPAQVLGISRTAENYLTLLRTIASQFSVLRKDKELHRQMRKTKFLLAMKTLPLAPQDPEKRATKLIEMEDDEDDFEDEDQAAKEWVLANAADVVLIDDPRSFSQFREQLLAAPQEEILESFYEALGAPYLSSLVEEKVRHGEASRDQRPAMKLQKQIYERSRLFLHDVSPDRVKYDTRWLEKNLKVQVVRSLLVHRSLRGRNLSHVEKRSAAVIRLKDWTLCITENSYDMHHVSEALVHFLLKRPGLSSALTLEMLLKTDLYELKSRGYNINRILRQKAAEARIAEDKRQQQMEAERAKQQEGSQQIVATEKGLETPRTRTQDKANDMPGVFPDSPEASHDESRDTNPLLTNAMNFFKDTTDLTSRRMQSLLGGSSQQNSPDVDRALPPPPYSNDGLQNISTGPQAGLVPTNLHDNLASAIKASRPHNSNSVYSRGETTEVKESKSYCDEKPAQDLALAGTSDHNISVYLLKSMTSRTSFMAANTGGFNAFSQVLLACAEVFEVRRNCVNIFYDPSGKTIAFNQQGSLFFNYRYFQDLHLHNNNPADAMIYWWVIYCHELAHNLVADHNSAHSYYTEGFVAQYFGKVAQRIAGSMAASSAHPPPAPAPEPHPQRSQNSPFSILSSW